MTTQQSIQTRPARREDLDALVELIRACDIAESGESDFVGDVLLEVWELPGFNLSTDAWVVQDGAGRIVGYEELGPADESGTLSVDGYVHPAFEGQGIGTQLLQLADARARQQVAATPAGPVPRLRGNINGKNVWAHQIFQEAGYEQVRAFYRMRIELDAPPPEPIWPQGITLQRFEPERDARALYEAIEEAFADHWGHAREPFEQWIQARMRGEEYDPALWLMAMDGDEVAGVAMGYYRPDNAGWVRGLAVRRPWRGRGLGMALLRQAFGEFYRRGRLRVGLGVDAHSPTGATRLYERAGMWVAETYATYEKGVGR